MKLKREQVTLRLLPETNKLLTDMASATTTPKGAVIEMLVKEHFEKLNAPMKR